MSYDFSESELEEIDAWVKQGKQPSEFLWRVINNDLIGAVAYANSQQEAYLAEFVLSFNSRVPLDCWGMKARAIAWRNKFNHAVEEEDGHAD